MSAHDEIKQIMEETKKGPLTAKRVVEKAKNAKKFPALHKHIWEVPEGELLMEARINRAHRLMIRLSVTTGVEGETTRLLVHTRGIPGYQPLNFVTNNPDLATSKLQQLTADIARARGRLRAFKAAIPDSVSDEIDDLLARAEAKSASAIADRGPVADVA